MMNKPKMISTRDQLPSWFDLKTYDHLRALSDFGQWSVLVGDLIRVRYLVEDYLEEAPPSRPDELEQFLQLIGTKKSMDERENLGHLSPHRFDKDNFRFRSVAAVSNSAVASLIRGGSKWPLMRKLVAGKNAPGLPTFRRTAFFRTLGEETGEGKKILLDRSLRVVMIDMSLTDDLIKADFATWLNAMRSYEERELPPRSFTENDLTKWKDDRYVPMAILLIWAKFHSFRITNKLLAETLFPMSARKAEENVKKSIRPAVEKWWSRETQYILGAKAAAP